MSFTLKAFIKEAGVELSSKEMRQLGSHLSIKLKKEFPDDELPKVDELVKTAQNKRIKVKVTEYYEYQRDFIAKETLAFMHILIERMSKK